MCLQSNYCIKSKYYCNGVENCPNDVSDEPEKCLIKDIQNPFPYLQIVVISGSIAILIVILSTCIICRIKAAKKAHYKKVAFSAAAYNKYNNNGNLQPTHHLVQPHLQPVLSKQSIHNSSSILSSLSTSNSQLQFSSKPAAAKSTQRVSFQTPPTKSNGANKNGYYKYSPAASADYLEAAITSV